MVSSQIAKRSILLARISGLGVSGLGRFRGFSRSVQSCCFFLVGCARITSGSCLLCECL